jgi:CRISPR system Cascade subunit CasC
MPTGKQNTFANRTLPSMVYVTVRSDQPINLAGAFEKPIVSYEGGFEEKSEDALIKYADELYAKFTDAPAKEWLIGGNKTTAVNVNFKELLNELEKEIESYIAEEE